MSCANCGGTTLQGATQCPVCGLPLASGSPPPSSWNPPPSGGWDSPPPGSAWGSPPGDPGNESWGQPSGQPGNPGQGPWGAPGPSYTPYPSGWNDLPSGASGHLAGWWRRVGATVIGGVIVWVPARIVDAAAGRILYSLFFVVATLLYTTVLLVNRGQTVGMMAVGTRCVTERSGSYLDYGPAVGRWAVTELLAITVVGALVDVLWPLWDGKNQTLHDKAVHTLVVRVT